MTPDGRLGHAILTDEWVVCAEDFVVLLLRASALPRADDYGSRLTETLWADLLTANRELVEEAWRVGLDRDILHPTWTVHILESLKASQPEGVTL